MEFLKFQPPRKKNMQLNPFPSTTSSGATPPQEFWKILKLSDTSITVLGQFIEEIASKTPCFEIDSGAVYFDSLFFIAKCDTSDSRNRVKRQLSWLHPFEEKIVWESTFFVFQITGTASKWLDATVKVAETLLWVVDTSISSRIEAIIH